jgi:uncharacterized LabA/DUF88 family protein
MSTAIFMDGGYLDRISKDYGSPRINYGALAMGIVRDSGAREEELLRCYYYHCLPYVSANPTTEELAREQGKMRFFKALRRFSHFEVREGKLEFRGLDPQTGEKVFEQKQVDTLMTVDLVTLSQSHRIRKAIIVTGDSDFIPAIQAAKNFGVVIHLYHGSGEQKPHQELWELADLRTEISGEFIQQFLLPEPGSPKDGQQQLLL